MIYFTGTAYRERYRARFQSNISVYTANVDRPVRWVEVGLQPMSTDRGQGLVHWWNQYKPTAFCNSCSAGDDPAVHAVDHSDVSKHDAIARPSPTTASVQRVVASSEVYEAQNDSSGRRFFPLLCATQSPLTQGLSLYRAWIGEQCPMHLTYRYGILEFNVPLDTV